MEGAALRKLQTNIPRIAQRCKTNWGLTCTTTVHVIMTLHWVDG